MAFQSVELVIDVDVEVVKLVSVVFVNVLFMTVRGIDSTVEAVDDPEKQNRSSGIFLHSMAFNI